LITVVRSGDIWQYRARYRLQIPANTNAELLLGTTAVQSIWINQQPWTGALPANLRLESHCTAVELVWHAPNLATHRPALLFAGELWQPPSQWEVVVPPGQTIVGVSANAEPMSPPPTGRANGPEWTSGVPYRFTVSEQTAQTPRVTDAPRPPITPSQYALLGSCLMFVLLTSGSNVRFAPEQLLCLAVATLACFGAAGLPALVLVFGAFALRLLDLRRGLQRHRAS
jgi:hypothetical protein